jgi:hypothetical protein
VEMKSVIEWIAATSLSAQLADWSIWLSPVCEILHFVGLSLLIGAAGFLDLRLLGVIRGVPVASALEFAPWAMVGFGLNAVTGVLFILIDPKLYLQSATWWAKVLFIVVAIVNVAAFERSSLGRRAREIGAGADTTPMMKAVAGTSLASWFLVMYFGRMLPYLGTAY